MFFFCEGNNIYIYFLRRNKNSHAIKYVKLSSSIMLEALEKLPGAQSLIQCDNMNDICKLLGLPMSNKKVTMSDLVPFRDSIKRDIRIYCSEEGQQKELFALKAKYPKNDQILLWIDEAPELSDEIKNISLICNPSFVRPPFRCTVNPKCNFTSFHRNNYTEHEKKCLEWNTPTIKSDQKCFGEDMDMMCKLVDAGFLPAEARLFRKENFYVYDIESAEDPTGAEGNVEAYHRPICISVASNTGFVKTVIRRDSSHESAIVLIREFVDILEEIVELDTLPEYFNDAKERLEELVNESESNFEKRKYAGLLNRLTDYMSTDIFGFNSGNFLFEKQAPLKNIPLEKHSPRETPPP